VTGHITVMRITLAKAGSSGEQIRAGLGEHVSSALVQHQPALLDGTLEPGLVFGRRSLEAEQGPLNLLDIDPAVLDRLEGIGELDDLAGRPADNFPRAKVSRAVVQLSCLSRRS